MSLPEPELSPMTLLTAITCFAKFFNKCFINWDITLINFFSSMLIGYFENKSLKFSESMQHNSDATDV